MLGNLSLLVLLSLRRSRVGVLAVIRRGGRGLLAEVGAVGGENRGRVVGAVRLSVAVLQLGGLGVGVVVLLVELLLGSLLLLLLLRLLLRRRGRTLLLLLLLLGSGGGGLLRLLEEVHRAELRLSLLLGRRLNVLLGLNGGRSRDRLRRRDRLGSVLRLRGVA